MYTVTLYENENMPYIIKDIEAENDNEAIYKAKKFVATNGYFPYMTEEQIMSILIVKNVVKDKWNRKSMVERIIEMNKYEEMGKANVRAFAERLKKELIKTKLVNGIEVIIEKDISTLDLFHTINSLLEEMECR